MDDPAVTGRKSPPHLSTGLESNCCLLPVRHSLPQEPKSGYPIPRAAPLSRCQLRQDSKRMPGYDKKRAACCMSRCGGSGEPRLKRRTRPAGSMHGSGWRPIPSLSSALGGFSRCGRRPPLAAGRLSFHLVSARRPRLSGRGASALLSDEVLEMGDEVIAIAITKLDHTAVFVVDARHGCGRGFEVERPGVAHRHTCQICPLHRAGRQARPRQPQQSQAHTEFLSGAQMSMRRLPIRPMDHSSAPVDSRPPQNRIRLSIGRNKS